MPLFLREDQSYLHIDEFKQALRELDEHYDGLPEEIKQLGVLQFASYPPSEMDIAVTRLWDKHMRPDWREVARRQEAELGKPRDEDASRDAVAEVRRRFEEARPVTDQETSLIGAGPDYFVIRRQVPVPMPRGSFQAAYPTIATVQTRMASSRLLRKSGGTATESRGPCGRTPCRKPLSS